MKLKFARKLMRKPKKKILQMWHFASKLIIPSGEDGIGRIVETSGKFEVCIESLQERADQHLPPRPLERPIPLEALGGKASHEAMAIQLEAIFRRFFFPRIDQFALATVQSRHGARQRQRQIQGMKELLAEMMEHWEGQGRRRFAGKDGEEEEEGLELFMDSYFGTLWDFLSECARILECAFPAQATRAQFDGNWPRMEKSRGRKRDRHSLHEYGPLTSTMLSAPVEEKKPGNGNNTPLLLDLDYFCGRTGRGNGPVELDGRRGEKHGGRPASLFYYF